MAFRKNLVVYQGKGGVISLKIEVIFSFFCRSLKEISTCASCKIGFYLFWNKND